MPQIENPLNRATYKLRPILFLLILGLPGCFSMGMPEIVNTTIATPQKPRMVALVVAPSAVAFHSEPELLGIQYVAALLPVTRLTLAHGPQLFLMEVAAEILQLAGYDPVVVSEASLPLAAQTLPFQHILRPQVQNLTVNAYDAFFFRILRVSGILQVDELRADTIELRRSTAVVIDETQYRTDGHAPTLSALLKRALAEKFKTTLRDLASPIRPTSQLTVAQEQMPLVAVNLLSGSPALRPVAALIESSYGFPGALGYNEHSVSRLIQRGMQASLEDRSIASVSTTFGAIPSFSSRRPFWSLSGVVEELAVNEQLILGLKLQLEEVRPGENASILLRAHCRGSFQEQDNLDGSWAFTLETAAGSLVVSFLQQGAECSAL